MDLHHSPRISSDSQLAGISLDSVSVHPCAPRSVTTEDATAAHRGASVAVAKGASTSSLSRTGNNAGRGRAVGNILSQDKRLDQYLSCG
jgi:hypothetical protein